MTEVAENIASGLNALMQQLDSVSHNIANVSTSGFKKRVTSFHQEYEKYLEALDGTISLTSTPVQAEHIMDFTQGTLVETERSLDLALEGKGFLVVETPDGPLYTRNGCLQINLLGQLIDLAGRIVAGQGGPIVIPPDVTESDLQVSLDGSISADGTTFGQLRLVDFGEDENRLLPAGLSAFTAPEDLTPEIASELTVRQGYQEQSNVKIVQELVNMMTLARLYEANLNVLRRERENSTAILTVANS